MAAPSARWPCSLHSKQQRKSCVVNSVVSACGSCVRARPEDDHPDQAHRTGSRCAHARCQSFVWHDCHRSSMRPHCVAVLLPTTSRCTCTAPCDSLPSLPKSSNAPCQAAAGMETDLALRTRPALSSRALAHTVLYCLGTFCPSKLVSLSSPSPRRRFASKAQCAGSASSLESAKAIEPHQGVFRSRAVQAASLEALCEAQDICRCPPSHPLTHGRRWTNSARDSRCRLPSSAPRSWNARPWPCRV
mmetsp:Transcript_51653/g.122951  ORF Transcript_51653/g.122951 Transcript_51653/m.122951 type:complete len:246 (-) Transcript_51653:831-1568(-)